MGLLIGGYRAVCMREPVKSSAESRTPDGTLFSLFGGGRRSSMSGLIGEPAKKSAESRTRTSKPLFFNVGISIF